MGKRKGEVKQSPSAHQGTEPHLSKEEKQVGEKTNSRLEPMTSSANPSSPTNRKILFTLADFTQRSCLIHQSWIKRTQTPVLSPDNLKRFSLTVNKQQVLILTIQAYNGKGIKYIINLLRKDLPKQLV